MNAQEGASWFAAADAEWEPIAAPVPFPAEEDHLERGELLGLFASDPAIWPPRYRKYLQTDLQQRLRRARHGRQAA